MENDHISCSSNLSLTTDSSWGGGCHASHQPSDASTPNCTVHLTQPDSCIHSASSVTSGQETEQVYSYNPGARTGPIAQKSRTSVRGASDRSLPTAECRSFPRSSGDELKRPSGNLLTGAGHTDDDRHAPALVTRFQRRSLHPSINARDVGFCSTGLLYNVYHSPQR